MGFGIGKLEEDLDSLRGLFDPLASGNRLRKLLTALPPVPAVRARLLGEPLVLAIGSEILVTLEGRVAISALTDIHRQTFADPMIINVDVIYNAEQLVGGRYRTWGMRRLEDVLRLMSGEAGSLRTSAIGWLLLLLINGSRSRETAIRRLDDPSEEQKLDQAVSRIVAAFADALSAGNRDTRHFSLYQGYALTEARRRLPGALGTDGNYIVKGQENRVIDLVASELSRPQRSHDIGDVLNAFDHLVKAYQEERPRLAVLGVAHERRGETRQIRQRLEDLIDGNRRRVRASHPSDKDDERG
jgi:hypothetical protein